MSDRWKALPNFHYVYNPEDWEYTTEDLSNLEESYVEDSDPGTIHEMGTLLKGPSIYGVKIPTKIDEDGDWLEEEIQWFMTEAEASDALLAAREANPMSEPDTSAEAVERLASIEDSGGCADLQFIGYASTLRALSAQNATLQARVDELEGAMKDADNCVTFEINPSNYGHDEVCLLNDQITEAILCLRAALKGDAQAEGEKKQDAFFANLIAEAQHD